VATKLPILSQINALADGTRSRILLLLEHHELTVSELVAILQLPQSTVSRHLKVLGDEGWIQGRGKGTSRWYRMRHAGLSPSAERLWGAVREDLAETVGALHDRERGRAIVAARRSSSKSFFAATAHRWDTVRRKLFGRHVEAAALLGLLDERWTVGDLGCGTGTLSASLAPFVRRVVAVDESQAMLDAAAARVASLGNVELRRGDLEALPITDGELDAALLILVLHHLSEPPAAIARAATALAPGGRLLIVDMLPHDREDLARELGHVWPGFAPEQVHEWLTDAGLRPRLSVPLPADLEATGPALFALAGVKPGDELGA